MLADKDNELSRRRLCLPVRTVILLPIPAWLIYSHILGAVLLSSGVFPELEGTGGAKCSCGERCTVCWDLHEIQPNVQLTNIPDARDSH